MTSCTFVLVSALLFFAPTTALLTFGEVMDIIKVSKDVVIGVSKLWGFIDDHTDFHDLPMPIIDKKERKLFHKMALINAKLDKLSEEMGGIGSQTIVSVLQNLPDRVRLELRLNDLLKYLTSLNSNYKNMQDYIKEKDAFERLTLEDFAQFVVSHHANSVRNLAERVHSFVVPTGNGFTSTGLIRLLEKTFEEVEGDMLCNSQQSPQQVLYNLYNEIALSELKGYTMIQFSYMLLKLYDKGNFTREAQIMKDRFEDRTNKMISTIRKSMTKASRELWMCDPKKHTKGETYEEITQLLQGYVQNEVDLNSEGSCWENCAAYTYTKSHSCYQNLYCRQQRRCNGKIINCRFYDSDMWICPADPSTGRRYEYIEYENGRVLGRKQGCPRGTTKVDSWWRWLVWHCSYCMCLCDEQGIYSDRYFNMRSAISNTKQNYVVTGLRFVKNNRIIHLQIQEGRLEPHGKIDVSSVQWVPVENYTILDRNIKNGQDYHTLTWESRAIDLDDLIADEGHVLTGVRFKEIGSHLNFEILVTPFDFATGRLIEPQSRSVWKDNINTDSSIKNPRKRVRLDNTDIPTRSPLPSLPDSKHDEYLEFTNTDFDRDAAQTTVPFLDSQPVTSLLPVPLSGAGIYHKGRKNFGGFIAPKVITYDYSKHLQPAFPDNEPEVN